MQSSALLVRAATVEQALEDSETLAAKLQELKSEDDVQTVHSIAALLPSRRLQEERLARFAALPREKIADGLRAALQRHGFRVEAFQAFLQDFTAPHTGIVTAGNPALAPFKALLDHYVRQQGTTATVATYVDLPPGRELPALAERLQRDLPK